MKAELKGRVKTLEPTETANITGKDQDISVKGEMGVSETGELEQVEVGWKGRDLSCRPSARRELNMTLDGMARKSPSRLAASNRQLLSSSLQVGFCDASVSRRWEGEPDRLSILTKRAEFCSSRRPLQPCARVVSLSRTRGSTTIARTYLKRDLACYEWN